jgi:hypothetical protein
VSNLSASGAKPEMTWCKNIFAPFAVKIRRLLTAKGAKFRRKGRKDVLAPRHFRFWLRLRRGCVILLLAPIIAEKTRNFV